LNFAEDPLSQPARIGRTLAVLSVMVLLTAGPASAQVRPAYEKVRQAKAEAGGVAEQAAALYELCWSDPPGDPEVAAIARAQLVQFGRHALEVLYRGMSTVPKRYTADLVHALIQAQRDTSVGLEPGYLPGLDAALWHGSVDAKRLAIPKLAARQYGPALLAVIDVAYDHPELTDLVIVALVTYGDDRARFFLDDILRHADARKRKLAAQALSRIGGRAVDTLRTAALNEEAATRQAAIAALVPVTALDDLTTLHEYVYRYPDDDAEIVEQVRQRALQLEALWEARAEQEGDSPSPD
jgi:hypothetical protein